VAVLEVSVHIPHHEPTLYLLVARGRLKILEPARRHCAIPTWMERFVRNNSIGRVSKIATGCPWRNVDTNVVMFPELQFSIQPSNPSFPI
jgi:hypothetical protein